MTRAAVTGGCLPVEQEPEPTAQDEEQRLVAALEATKGRIYGEYGAAQLLGMNPERLRYGIRKNRVNHTEKSCKSYGKIVYIALQDGERNQT